MFTDTQKSIAISLLDLPLWVKSSIIRHFNFNLSDLWEEKCLDLDPRWKSKVESFKLWEQVNDIENRAKTSGISILTPCDSGYPKELRQIVDFPVVLYCMGNLELLNSRKLAVVGTRQITSYGRYVVSRFIPKLLDSGLCIVSGMAKGVDSFAHMKTLEKGGKTIAVLGARVDRPSPYQNKHVYEGILEHGGLIISEYNQDSVVYKSNFPARNRIVSGLSIGVFVVEAGEKSGSLITAGLSEGYGREVFTVPAPINSKLSSGNNELIKKGAVVVTCPEEILQHYEVDNENKQKPFSSIDEASEEHRKLLTLLDTQGLDLNELMLLSGIPTSSLLKSLEELEHTGYIGKDEFGIYYSN